MSLELLTQVLSVCTFVSTLIQFLTGVPICLNIRRQRQVGEISGIPFLVGFLLNATWVRYGFLKGTLFVIAVNGAGTLIYASYVVYYFFYSWPKRSYIIQLGITLVILAGLFVFVQIVPNFMILGIICIVLNILSLGSPLAGLGVVLRNREVSSLPLPMCAVNLFASIEWVLYAVLVHDINLLIPNAAGIILAVIQLSLFIVFPTHKCDRSPLEKLSKWFTGRNMEQSDDDYDMEKGEKPAATNFEKITKLHGRIEELLNSNNDRRGSTEFIMPPAMFKKRSSTVADISMAKFK